MGRVLRRPKQDRCADFWHTLRIGLVVAVLLFLILPWLMGG